MFQPDVKYASRPYTIPAVITWNRQRLSNESIAIFYRILSEFHTFENQNYKNTVYFMRMKYWNTSLL
jgi:hypothetical protein